MAVLRKYLEYLKRERKEIQKVHAVFVAAIMTAFFTGIYLYVLYDITPPKPEISFNQSHVYVRDPNSDFINNNTINDIQVDNSEYYAKQNENKLTGILDRFANVFVGFQAEVENLKQVLQREKTYKAEIVE